jgi:hypothetical protein
VPSAPRFLEQDRHRDDEAFRAVAAGVLARDPVEPALAAPADREIGGVDRQHAPFLRHAPVEPVREREAEPPALLRLRIDQINPLVEPAEDDAFAVAARDADVRGDDGGFEAIKGSAQLSVILPAGSTANNFEEVVWRELIPDPAE